MHVIITLIYMHMEKFSKEKDRVLIIDAQMVEAYITHQTIWRKRLGIDIMQY